MTHDQVQDHLSAWLDGELDDGARRQVDAHLAECPACQGIARDLQRVVGVAAGMPVTGPGRNLWPGIADRIHRPVAGRIDPEAPRTIPLGHAGLVAAGLLLGVLLGRVVPWPSRPGSEGPPLATSRPAAQPARNATLDATQLSQSTAVAVGQLEQLLLAETGRLDTSTVRVLAQNLARIDSAIAEAQRALAADPSNAYVSRHLAATTRRKVDLLRRVAILTQPGS
jgi:anti-sigma factor RsiW